MSTSPTFGTQLIGQTEKALNAILDRQLAGTGLTEPQWVILTIAVMSGGTIAPASFVGRIADALKISAADARAQIDELTATNLLEKREDDRFAVGVTDTGSELHRRVRADITEITHRLWGDLPADELHRRSRPRHRGRPRQRRASRKLGGQEAATRE